MSTWDILDSLSSRGSTVGKAGSLGAMHEHRKVTLSQFFTPEWLVRFIWNSLSPAFKTDERYSLLDNSVGSARMFRFADPARFKLAGIDVDGELLSKVSAELDTAGYEVDFVNCSLEQATPGKYSAAMINPPFSIPLAGPTLTAYEGITHYGRHGPNTSAVSHEYALAQALDSSDIVAAVVPRSVTNKLHEFRVCDGRLRAIYQLPADTFSDESVQAVGVDLLIFGKALHGVQAKTPDHIRVKQAQISRDTQPLPLFLLACKSVSELPTRGIRVLSVNASQPVVTLPPSNDKRVLLVRGGRNIRLQFHDGATEGRVMNAIYKRRLLSSPEHRYPPKTKYDGQFQLSLDAIVLQDDPWAALEAVAETIRNAGGEPVIHRKLKLRLQELIDEHAKMTVPFGRTVYRQGSPVLKGTAKRMALLNRHQTGAVVAMGDKIHAERKAEGFLVTTPRGTFDCEHDLFFSAFEIGDQAMNSGYWEDIAPPIRASYPDEIMALERKAKALGVDKWLTWDFQREDLYELAFRPHGAICGWQMALGKSRLALALALLIEGSSLLVVKSRLIDEMLREIRQLGIAEDVFQVVESARQARSLRKINIISYERLRRPLDRRCKSYTMARILKGRVGALIADEGGLLSNVHSDQTTAVWKIGAKRRYIFDGTPCPNYPREMLPLACWTTGQARSYQPYSLKQGYLDARLFNTAARQQTGRNAFNEQYVVIEWATNEFLDSGKGARREVPKINSRHLWKFRQWIAPMVKRRVQQEPAVARHVRFPVPTLNAPTVVDWSVEHLMIYIAAVEDFADWYKTYVAEQEASEKGLNLTMILMRLEACFKAANTPSKVSGFATPMHSLTNKEIAVIEAVEAEITKGRRPIVFARNPVVLRRLGKALSQRSISHLIFTGEQAIKKRIAALNREIRDGSAQVLLAQPGRHPGRTQPAGAEYVHFLQPLIQSARGVSGHLPPDTAATEKRCVRSLLPSCRLPLTHIWDS